MLSVRRSDDSLGATALDRSPYLFRYGETQTVDGYLLRMLFFQPACVKILQYVHADISSEKMLPRAISLIIKMMLLYCGKFHFCIPRFVSLRECPVSVSSSVKIYPLKLGGSRRDHAQYPRHPQRVQNCLNAKNPDAHTYKLILK